MEGGDGRTCQPVFVLHVCSGVDGWSERWTAVGHMGRW